MREGWAVAVLRKLLYVFSFSADAENVDDDDSCGKGGQWHEALLVVSEMSSGSLVTLRDQLQSGRSMNNQ
eukprot:931785-Karenia_brevis.AAC.1